MLPDCFRGLNPSSTSLGKNQEGFPSNAASGVFEVECRSFGALAIRKRSVELAMTRPPYTASCASLAPQVPRCEGVWRAPPSLFPASPFHFRCSICKALTPHDAISSLSSVLPFPFPVSFFLGFKMLVNVGDPLLFSSSRPLFSF